MKAKSRIKIADEYLKKYYPQLHKRISSYKSSKNYRHYETAKRYVDQYCFDHEYLLVMAMIVDFIDV